MKFSVRDGIVFRRFGKRAEEIFCFLPDSKKLVRSVLFVTCMMVIWTVGFGPVERIRELQNALCHSGSAKFIADFPRTFSCETMARDLEILSYLWLAATIAVPFILFRRRPPVVSPATSNPGPTP